MPAIPLFAAAIVFNRRCVWIIGIATIAAVFGVMGLCIPWRTLLAPRDSALTLRVLTCNVHVQAVHARQLADLIAEVKPDIVVLQEWTPPYDHPIFNGNRWNVVTTGEMCLATRFPIETAGEVQNAAAVHYVLETPAGKVDFYNVHFASPHHPLQDALHGMPSGLDDLETNVETREREARLIDKLAQSIAGPVLIAGDFNLWSDSPIFRESFSNYSDAFITAGFGFGLTYRVKRTSARIDHILGNNHWIYRDCWVGPDVGSTHHPMIADLSLRASK